MIWDTLGIDKTTDIKKIKSAYSALAKLYNPEDNPDKFMEIHNAYKEACEYARHNKAVTSDISEKIGSVIVVEKNIVALISDSIIKCSVYFGTGNVKENTIDDSTKKNESDFDFSDLKVFSQDKSRNKEHTIEEIQNIILDDMNRIVNDKDMINSYYVWDSFLSNKIVVDTISNKAYTDKLDMILNHKRFIKEIAELVSGLIGNNTKIIRNTDFGFYYIDVTGKRKLYYYVTSNHSRKIKLYYNILWIIILLLILLIIILF